MSNFRVTASRNGGRSFGNNRHEHDDRVTNPHADGFGTYGSGNQHSYEGGSYKSRGRNYKTSYGGGRGGSRGRGRGGPNPRSYVDLDAADGDVDMAGGSQSKSGSRFNPYGKKYTHPNASYGRYNQYDDRRPRGYSRPPRGSSSRGHSSSYPSNRPSFSADGWYKVTIPNGSKSGREFILANLAQMSQVSFTPFNFQLEDRAASFYVEDRLAAAALYRCSHQVTTPDGPKMPVSVRFSPTPPITKLNPQIETAIETCMNERYDAANKRLNLSSFHKVDDLNRACYYVQLYRRDIMECILRIIKEKIPQLVGLDISNNKLSKLNTLYNLDTAAPNLTELDLAGNDLRLEGELDDIKRLNLLKLNLDANPMCDRFPDKPSYISAVRRRFPKVIELDGHTDLPVAYTFDLDEATIPMPTTLGGYSPNPAGMALVKTFVDQYLSIYDTADRSPLINAYHDQAVFSLCVSQNRNAGNTQWKFLSMQKHSRNMNVKGRDAITNPCKHLRLGRDAIISLLKELPHTEHIQGTIVIDITQHMEQLVCFTVTGMFRQRDVSKVFSFCRIFVTVPMNAGLAIVNEQLNVTLASPEQVKIANSNPVPTPSPSPVQPGPSVAAVAGSPVAVPAPGLTEEQQAMIGVFSKESGMNINFSAQCLSELDWNFDAAAKRFLELKASGAIPAEAFIH